MSDTKRRRRDAGSVRYGPRDLVGMSWCATQGAMRIDQLAQLFSQIDGRPVSSDAARKSVGRWLDRGWATSRTLLKRSTALRLADSGRYASKWVVLPK